MTGSSVAAGGASVGAAGAGAQALRMSDPMIRAPSKAHKIFFLAIVSSPSLK
jgi:hypothetical protein